MLKKRKNTKNANRTEVNNYEKLEISTGGITSAMLTCAEKLTKVSLIYRMEPTTKKWKNRKTKK